MDYARFTMTGKTVETEKINKAIGDVSARQGSGTLYFPPGIYRAGTVVMQGNVNFYVAAGAVIKGTRKQADYIAGAGIRNRSQFLFNNMQNASLTGRDSVDMEGYPWLWHDFQPDPSEGTATSPEGLVRDPGGNGIKGYIVHNSRNITFDGLVLLRSAYWTITVTNTDGFTSRNIQNKFAFMVQATPAYTVGRGTSSGPQPGQASRGPFRGGLQPSKNAGLDDFRVVNCSFESDGGHLHIDGGDVPLTNFVFENCTFYKADRPGKLLGNNVAPIVFKNVTMNGAVVRNLAQFEQAGYEVSVPLKFEP